MPHCVNILQARHLVLVEEFYKTEPQKSRSSQRNESTVGIMEELALKNIPKGRRYGISAESQKLKKTRAYWDSARNLNDGTIVERHLEDDQYQTRMHEQGYSYSDMEEFDRKST